MKKSTGLGKLSAKVIKLLQASDRKLICRSEDGAYLVSDGCMIIKTTDRQALVRLELTDFKGETREDSEILSRSIYEASASTEVKTLTDTQVMLGDGVKMVRLLRSGNHLTYVRFKYFDIFKGCDLLQASPLSLILAYENSTLAGAFLPIRGTRYYKGIWEDLLKLGT